MKTTVALIDDHRLIRNALSNLIDSFEDFTVILEADNGLDFFDRINDSELPEIVLLDIHMPEMDGFETALILKQKYSSIKVLALSIENQEESIIKMIKCGAKGYLLKDCPIEELELALQTILINDFYHTELISNSLLHASINQSIEIENTIDYKAREFEFLQLACSELTYKEIANNMCVSPRTIDGYRENLFYKLNVKSRVGMVIFAIRNGIVNL